MTRVVLVGATGAVGEVMLSILQERDFPADELVPVASARSAGRMLPFKNERIEVRELQSDVFDGADLALFDVPDALAFEWAPVAVAAGAVVVDNSAAWRMHPEVPLVVPEVNPGAVADRPLGILASPNCSTLAMVVPLHALHQEAGLVRVIASTYQATSGVGRHGVVELWDQTLELAGSADAVAAGSAGGILRAGEAFPHPIAMNVIPLCGSVRDDGYTSEELKLCHETRKIMGLPDLRATATCVRVPVVDGHCVAVHAEFERPVTVETARKVFADAPGVELLDDPDHGVYPTPLAAAGHDGCYVGRIRQDMFDPRALELFCVSDNLRKGAALNTVQVAELLL